MAPGRVVTYTGPSQCLFFSFLVHSTVILRLSCTLFLKQREPRHTQRYYLCGSVPERRIIIVQKVLYLLNECKWQDAPSPTNRTCRAPRQLYVFPKRWKRGHFRQIQWHYQRILAHYQRHFEQQGHIQHKLPGH